MAMTTLIPVASAMQIPMSRKKQRLKATLVETMYISMSVGMQRKMAEPMLTMRHALRKTMMVREIAAVCVTEGDANNVGYTNGEVYGCV